MQISIGLAARTCCGKVDAHHSELEQTAMACERLTILAAAPRWVPCAQAYPWVSLVCAEETLTCIQGLIHRSTPSSLRYKSQWLSWPGCQPQCSSLFQSAWQLADQCPARCGPSPCPCGPEQACFAMDRPVTDCCQFCGHRHSPCHRIVMAYL